MPTADFLGLSSAEWSAIAAVLSAIAAALSVWAALSRARREARAAAESDCEEKLEAAYAKLRARGEPV